MAVAAALVSAIGVAIASDSSATPPAAIFVANLRGYVTVYALGSNGDAAPVSTIDGAATRLSEPEAIAVDARGTTYVTCGNWANSVTYLGSSILAFSAGSKGNATPIAAIAGPRTGLRTAFSLAVDTSGNIYVGTSIGNDGPIAVETFAAGSNGDVKPRTAIFGLNTELQNTSGLAVDPKGTLFVGNASMLSKGNGVLVFPAGSNGNVMPSAVINEANGDNGPAGVALDPRGNIYVLNAARLDVPANIRIYSAGSNGNVPPIATISGPNTGLNGRAVRGIALDSKENIYVTSDWHDSTESSITVFAHGSNGNVKPIAVISGDNTGLSGAIGIAIGPYPGSN